MRKYFVNGCLFFKDKRSKELFNLENDLELLTNFLTGESTLDLEEAVALWLDTVKLALLSSETYVELLEKHNELGEKSMNIPLLDDFSKKMFAEILKKSNEELEKAKAYDSKAISSEGETIRDSLELISTRIEEIQFEEMFGEHSEVYESEIS